MGGNTFANLGGICVRGRGVREHPGRPKHGAVLVAAAAVLTVRVEAEAHPRAKAAPPTLYVLPSAAGRRLTVREQLPALQPVSLLPRRKPACVVTRRQSLEKLKSKANLAFTIVI